MAFNLVSATQCGAGVRCATSANPGKSNDGTEPQDIICETVHWSIVEGGLHQSQIYEIMTVMFDPTLAYTGWLGGLGKKLKELFKAAWEEDKASGIIPDWLGPVTDLEKGCEDHLTALISTEFAKRWKPHLLLNVCLYVCLIYKECM